jgi:hypothetical protein
LTGLLYLENTLTSYAFTPDRIAILEVLAAQAPPNPHSGDIASGAGIQDKVKRATTTDDTDALFAAEVQSLP